MRYLHSMRHAPRTDGTLVARQYLHEFAPQCVADPVERLRRLNLLQTHILGQIRGLTFFAVPEHWMVRVQGPPESLDQLAQYVERKAGLEFIPNTPTLSPQNR